MELLEIQMNNTEPLQIIDPEIITARELATHANDIEHLQDDMDKLVKDMEQIKQSIDEIKRTLSEAKGGWRVLMWAGGAVSALTGAAGFISGHWIGK